MPEMIVSWSGGKDSSATLLLADKLGVKVDKAIFTEIMFDNTRGISAEQPDHIAWMYDYAIPKVKSMGVDVIVLRSDKDFVSWYKQTVRKSKVEQRNGKMHGFPLQGKCGVSSELKLKPLDKYKRQYKDAVWLLGIAADEPERVARIKPPNRSLLAEQGVTEQEAYAMCKKEGLLSPVYDLIGHGGNCWFCPNGNVRQFAILKRFHPELWEEFCNLPVDNLISSNFGFQGPIEEFKRRVEEYKLMFPRYLLKR